MAGRLRVPIKGSQHGARGFSRAPIPAESSMLPSNDCFGLHNKQRRAPLRPEARQPCPDKSVRRVQTKPAALRPLQDYQLVTQGKVFQLQRCSSSKPRSDAKQCGKQSTKHEIRTLTMCPNKIIILNLNEVIGSHSRDFVTRALAAGPASADIA